MFLDIEAPAFDIRDITEEQMNVTWSMGSYYGMHVVYYVEFRKEGKIYYHSLATGLFFTGRVRGKIIWNFAKRGRKNLL